MASLKFEQIHAAPESGLKCSITLNANAAGQEHRLGLVRECTSIRELAAEVENLRRELDEILRQGRAFFGIGPSRVAHPSPDGSEMRDATQVLPKKMTLRNTRTVVAARRKVLRKQLLRRRNNLARGSRWRRWFRIGPSAADDMRSARFQQCIDSKDNTDLVLGQAICESNLMIDSVVHAPHPMEREHGMPGNQ